MKQNIIYYTNLNKNIDIRRVEEYTHNHKYKISSVAGRRKGETYHEKNVTEKCGYERH